MDYILVIDAGTSSMRGMLFDEKGKLKFTQQKQYFMIVDGDKATQKATDFSLALEEICKDISAQADGPIIALSFTSQRSSVVPVNQNGEPLSDVMMWYDKRANEICAKLNSEAEAAMYAICGMKASPVYSAPKIAWFKMNQPELYEKAYKFIGIHDYLIYQTTGEFVTDTSLASRTGLLNIQTSAWSEELFGRYGIDQRKLCKIIPVGAVAGTVKKDFSERTGIPAGIPVVSAGGDQQCSALGQSIVNGGQVGITSGTASYVVAISEQAVFDKKRRTNINISARPDKWIVEASNLSSGAVYNWMKKALYSETISYDVVNQDIAAASPLAKGLLMFPDLSGKGCPQWDQYAKGNYMNIGFQHQRKDFARATIEGIVSEIA